jgi:hypothetical protein
MTGHDRPESAVTMGQNTHLLGRDYAGHAVDRPTLRHCASTISAAPDGFA